MKVIKLVHQSEDRWTIVYPNTNSILICDNLDDAQEYIIDYVSKHQSEEFKLDVKL